jgi:hypothetical protein
LCSGKIYHDLAHAREKRGADDIAIIRFEQLYPIQKAELEATLASYSDDTDMVWVQEEPWNMGAWFFMNARFSKVSGYRFKLRCVRMELTLRLEIGLRPHAADDDAETDATLDLTEEDLQVLQRMKIRIDPEI